MKCARYGCTNEVEQSGVGRPRRFCSPACKSADYKRRHRQQRNQAWVSAATGSAVEAAMVRPTADLDTQVVLAVHEAIALRNTFERLSGEARVELAARCDGMASALGAALLANFRGAIDG